MRRLRRNRPKREPPALIGRWGNASFLAFMLLSVLWLVLIETTLNAGWAQSVRWLWMPLALAVALYVHRYWDWLQARTRGPLVWKTAVPVVSVYLLLLLMAWPYVLALNAVGASEAVAYEGTLERKQLNRGKSTSYTIVITDRRMQASIEVNVSQRQYASVAPGDVMRCDFRKGWLGIVYRWRYTDAGSACHRVESP